MRGWCALFLVWLSVAGCAGRRPQHKEEKHIFHQAKISNVRWGGRDAEEHPGVGDDIQLYDNDMGLFQITLDDPIRDISTLYLPKNSPLNIVGLGATADVIVQNVIINRAEVEVHADCRPHLGEHFAPIDDHLFCDNNGFPSTQNTRCVVHLFLNEADFSADLEVRVRITSRDSSINTRSDERKELFQGAMELRRASIKRDSTKFTFAGLQEDRESAISWVLQEQRCQDADAQEPEPASFEIWNVGPFHPIGVVSHESLARRAMARRRTRHNADDGTLIDGDVYYDHVELPQQDLYHASESTEDSFEEIRDERGGESFWQKIIEKVRNLPASATAQAAKYVRRGARVFLSTEFGRYVLKVALETRLDARKFPLNLALPVSLNTALLPIIQSRGAFEVKFHTVVSRLNLAEELGDELMNAMYKMRTGQLGPNKNSWVISFDNFFESLPGKDIHIRPDGTLVPPLKAYTRQATDNKFLFEIYSLPKIGRSEVRSLEMLVRETLFPEVAASLTPVEQLLSRLFVIKVDFDLDLEVEMALNPSMLGVEFNMPRATTRASTSMKVELGVKLVQLKDSHWFKEIKRHLDPGQDEVAARILNEFTTFVRSTQQCIFIGSECHAFSLDVQSFALNVEDDSTIDFRVGDLHMTLPETDRSWKNKLIAATVSAKWLSSIKSWFINLYARNMKNPKFILKFLSSPIFVDEDDLHERFVRASDVERKELARRPPFREEYGRLGRDELVALMDSVQISQKWVNWVRIGRYLKLKESISRHCSYKFFLNNPIKAFEKCPSVVNPFLGDMLPRRAMLRNEVTIKSSQFDLSVHPKIQEILKALLSMAPLYKSGVEPDIEDVDDEETIFG